MYNLKKMPDYSKGVIYTIRCRYDTSLIYVGSTICALCKRWGGHKSKCFNPNFKGYNMILYQKIRETSWNDFYIELYEKYPCNDREELEKREGEVIREIGTLNKNKRVMNVEELKKKNYEQNDFQTSFVCGEKEKQKRKEYYEQNKKKIAEQQKQYREANKEKIKQYREDHKEKIKQYREDKVTCQCGSIVGKYVIARHCKSKKHQAWEDTQTAATNDV